MRLPGVRTTHSLRFDSSNECLDSLKIRGIANRSRAVSRYCTIKFFQIERIFPVYRKVGSLDASGSNKTRKPPLISTRSGTGRPLPHHRDSPPEKWKKSLKSIGTLLNFDVQKTNPFRLVRRSQDAASRQTPNAERRTPNASRQTPNAKRQTPNAKRQMASISPSVLCKWRTFGRTLFAKSSGLRPVCSPCSRSRQGQPSSFRE